MINTVWIDFIQGDVWNILLQAVSVIGLAFIGSSSSSSLSAVRHES